MPVVGSGSQTTITQPKTFIDLYTEVLNKMKQPQTVSGIIEQAKRYVNTALFDMVYGFEYKLPWLEREGTLITMTPYTTGTVSVSVGSTALVGVGTAWNTTNAFGVANARTTGKLLFGDGNIYAIASVNSDTTITLRTRYVGSAALSGSSYIYFEDEYDLASDFLKPVDYRMFSGALNIRLIGRDEFRMKYPRPNIAGKPGVATMLDKAFSTSAVQPLLVQLYPYPSAQYLVPYSYITKNLAVSTAGAEQEYMIADTDEPMLPFRYRQAIISFAIWKWYRDKKDDARAESAHADYIDEITRIVSDQRIGANTTMRIAPKVSMYANRAAAPYRGGSRRFSTNNSFDDFRT